MLQQLCLREDEGERLQHLRHPRGPPIGTQLRGQHPRLERGQSLQAPRTSLRITQQRTGRRHQAKVNRHIDKMLFSKIQLQS